MLINRSVQWKPHDTSINMTWTNKLFCLITTISEWCAATPQHIRYSVCVGRHRRLPSFGESVLSSMIVLCWRYWFDVVWVGCIGRHLISLPLPPFIVCRLLPRTRTLLSISIHNRSVDEGKKHENFNFKPWKRRWKLFLYIFHKIQSTESKIIINKVSRTDETEKQDWNQWRCSFAVVREAKKESETGAEQFFCRFL